MSVLIDRGNIIKTILLVSPITYINAQLLCEKNIKMQFNKKKTKTITSRPEYKRIKTIVNGCRTFFSVLTNQTVLNHKKKFRDTLNALIIIIYSTSVFCIPTTIIC